MTVVVLPTYKQAYRYFFYFFLHAIALLLLTGLGNVICRRMDCKMSHVVLHTEDRATAHP